MSRFVWPLVLLMGASPQPAPTQVQAAAPLLREVLKFLGRTFVEVGAAELVKSAIDQPREVGEKVDNACPAKCKAVLAEHERTLSQVRSPTQDQSAQLGGIKAIHRSLDALKAGHVQEAYRAATDASWQLSQVSDRTLRSEAEAVAENLRQKEARITRADQQIADRRASAAPRFLLRFHGSNTIGETLMPVLVRAYLENELHDTHVREESAAPARQSEELVSYLVGRNRPGGEDWIEISANGTEHAFDDLEKGTADIGMASNQISEDRARALLGRLGDLRSRDGEHVIALDAVVAIVNRANPLQHLTLSQLADIYSGKVKDWSELGGPGGPVDLYARHDESGTWEVFKARVLEPSGVTLGRAYRIEDSRQLSEAVHSDVRGIGFIGFNYIGRNRPLALSAADAVAPRLPTTTSIKTEEYVLTRRLYLYTSTQPTSRVARFIDFATGPKAWAVIADAGLVNIDPGPVKGAEPSPAGAQPHSSEYLALTRHYLRLQTNFRFAIGGWALDTRGYQDLVNVSRTLCTPAYANHTLRLFGYADRVGSNDYNLALSQERAEEVRHRLKDVLSRCQVTITLALGMGAQDFLVPNDTEARRAQNRRVEVWVSS